MDPQMMPSQQGGENEQIVDQILMAVTQILEMAGPEWTMEFLMAGMQEAQAEAQPPAGGPPQAPPPSGIGAGAPVPPPPLR